MKKFIEKHLLFLRLSCIMLIISMFVFTKANFFNGMVIAALFIIGGILLRPRKKTDETSNIISEPTGQVTDSDQNKSNPIVQTPDGMGTVIDQTKIEAEKVEPLIEADPKDLEFQEKVFRDIAEATEKFKVEKQKLEEQLMRVLYRL